MAVVVMIENSDSKPSPTCTRAVKLGEVRRLGAIITSMGYTTNVRCLQLAVQDFGAGNCLTRLYSSGPLEYAFGKCTIGGP